VNAPTVPPPFNSGLPGNPVPTGTLQVTSAPEVFPTATVRPATPTPPSAAPSLSRQTQVAVLDATPKPPSTGSGQAPRQPPLIWFGIALLMSGGLGLGYASRIATRPQRVDRSEDESDQ
jgi:hypothetical protein